MRISDWSSDVCSSDLAMARVSAMSDVPAGRYAAAGSDDVAADPADVDAFSDMLDAAPDRCCGREVEVPPERRRHDGEGGREGAVLEFQHGERQPAVLAFLHVEVDHHEVAAVRHRIRSEEHTSELQSLMRNSYAVFCLKKQ